MVSIGEFAHALQLNIKTIRYYHNLGILIPACIDPDSKIAEDE